MSRYCRTFLLAGILLLPGLSAAEEQPYRIVKSLSPNGAIELWVKPEDREGEAAAGKVLIRQVKNGQTLGTFEWSGFGVKLVGPDPPFDVSWRGDGRYFAIGYEEARGWITGAIYGRAAQDQWLQVKMPADAYSAAIKKVSGVTELYGKGCERPVEWTRKGELVLEFVDRNLAYDHEYFEKQFLVTLKVSDWLGRPLKTAKIVSIKQRSREETQRELQRELEMQSWSGAGQ